MIDRLKPYPDYVDSGRVWLGKIPEHWAMERAKWLFQKMNRDVRDADEVVTCFRDGTVTLRKNRRLRGFTESIKEIGYQGIRRGDLIIHAMDAFAGAIGVSDSDGKGSPVYSVCQSKNNANSYYYAYIVREMARTQWIFALAKGIRERSTDFRFETFASQFVPIPPPDEQAAIVRFLDHADRRIWRYIRAKRQLIALLNEQKQAIIHRAVTRGLDPNVCLKPSGVEWLGDVPEHWKLSRVKSEFVCLNNRRIPLSGPERGAMKLRLYDYYGASGVIDKVDDYIYNDELLLIAEDGANLVLRNLPLAIVARGKFWVNNHAHILKPRNGNLEYLAHLMETLNYLPWISGAAQPKLTKDRLLSIVIVVAPPEEQDRIVRHIGSETEPLAIAADRARREVEILREYRTRLIADVVTGKLDVWQAAAQLPEVVEEGDTIADESIEGDDVIDDSEIDAETEKVEV